jgi:prepilin-type N-terminal cleavage/methylation domain-containing protein
MTLRKGFTLVEMLVVIMIIAILAAALFPAITAAIATAKATAMKNKGRGIWTAVLSANAEREPLGMGNVWPGPQTVSGTGPVVPTTSTDYFKYLLGCGLGSGGAANSTVGSAICEDLKTPALAGAGVSPASDPASFAAINNAWCACSSNCGTNPVSEDAFICTRNVDFEPAAANAATVPNTSRSVLMDSANPLLGSFSLNRGIYVTYGGACIDRRAKYMPIDQYGNNTNNLVSSTNTWIIYRP